MRRLIPLFTTNTANGSYVVYVPEKSIFDLKSLKDSIKAQYRFCKDGILVPDAIRSSILPHIPEQPSREIILDMLERMKASHSLLREILIKLLKTIIPGEVESETVNRVESIEASGCLVTYIINDYSKSISILDMFELGTDEVGGDDYNSFIVHFMGKLDDL